MARARITVALLVGCQALQMTSNFVMVGLNAIVGASLAGDRALATLPMTAYVLGIAITTIPASLLMRRIGRRAGFASGAVLGMAGALTCAAAVATASFALFSLGAVLVGGYAAFGQYYRFAAAEVSDGAFRSQAISLVLGGGLLGAVLGPESSKLTKDLLTTPYLAPYLTLAAFAGLALALQLFMRIPAPPAAERAGSGRPLAEIVRQPAFIVAVTAAITGYGVMNFLMTATPLAMLMHHHPFGDTAFVIEWHALAMFAPSFVTGILIRRFGVLAVMSWGAVLMIGCTVVASRGVGLFDFWTALVLLGIGWNFLYVSGTTLLIETYRPEERAKCQGLNDLLVFTSTVATSFLSGMMLHSLGWRAMAWATLPVLALAIAGTLWLAQTRRAGRAA